MSIQNKNILILREIREELANIREQMTRHYDMWAWKDRGMHEMIGLIIAMIRELNGKDYDWFPRGFVQPR